MAEDLIYRKSGRSRSALITVALIWGALLLCWTVLEAHPLILAFFALTTLPTCWDIVTNPRSGMTLNDHQIHWFSGKRSVTLPLSEVERVHMNTRLDFSVKVSLALQTGTKLVVPFEATPPDTALEAALTARGTPVRRTHFQLFQ
ncbi:MAG: hypothetical protein AAF943_18055 [Pseudomonadota bacterium]